MNNRIKHWQEVADKCVAAHTLIEEAFEPAIKCGMMDIDGRVHEDVWRAFETMLAALDRNGWIVWFIYDNGKGKIGRKYQKTLNGKPVKITTTRQLARIIAEEEAGE